ncbi:MAG: diacylglycerol/polyprenol kinase family protein [Pseudanabaenaceae cyanobacterium]
MSWLELLIQGGAIVSWLAIVLALGMVAKLQFANPEIARKVVHIGTGNVILIAWALNASIYLCLTVAIAFTIIAFLSYYTNILPMLVGIGRQTRGVFYYGLSITLLVAIFWHTKPELVVIGVMVMSWGDGLAALIGQKWGRHKYTVGPNQRSWEGSAIMLLVSYILVGVILQWTDYPHSWLVSLPVAVLSAILEAVSLGGTDNFTVPLATTLLCFGLTAWFS